jgi:hypothetical protein
MWTSEGVGLTPKAGRSVCRSCDVPANSSGRLRVGVYASPLPETLDPGAFVKLLLTAGGVRNASIRRALVDLLGKPVEEASAL